MGSKELYTFRENVQGCLCDAMDSFKTICKTVGSNRQSVVINKNIFRDFVPADKLAGRAVVMTWEYDGRDSSVTFTTYKIDHHAEEWETIKKVVRYSYGYKWPDTTELRDLLITFVAGGYDGQHFKDGVF